MENKKTLLIVSVLLVVLIGGASVLYAKLGDHIKPDNLLIQNGSGTNTSDTTTVTPGTSINDTTDPSDKPTIIPGNSSETGDSSSESNGTSSGNSTADNTADENSPFTARTSPSMTGKETRYISRIFSENLWY